MSPAGNIGGDAVFYSNLAEVIAKTTRICSVVCVAHQQLKTELQAVESFSP